MAIQSHDADAATPVAPGPSTRAGRRPAAGSRIDWERLVTLLRTVELAVSVKPARRFASRIPRSLLLLRADKVIQ